MPTVSDWVRKYLDKGWAPIPLAAGDKGPRVEGWESTPFTEADFEDDSNIGIRLGREGIYDVDLDAKDAIVAARILLPATKAIFGRAGKPQSHWFYTSTDNIEHTAYYGLGGPGDCIVELRGFNKKGEPTQTMVPPSRHPSGDVLYWEGADILPMNMGGDLLRRAVRNIAIATLVARQFPGEGHRHEPRLALAGYLLKSGVDKDEVREIGRAVMKLVGGDEQDWLLVCSTTIGKHESADPKLLGAAKLRECLVDGDKTIKLLNKWLGRTQIAAEEDWIDRLNKQYFICQMGEIVCIGDEADPDRIRFWQFPEFKKLFTKEFLPGSFDKNGKYRNGENVADMWIKHKDGRRAGRVVYAPPGSPLRRFPDDFNGWRGFACEPKRGDWSLIKQHLKMVICGGDEAILEWVMNWAADLVQRPGQHGNSAIMLQGGQGVGKGTFAHDLLGKMFDRRHYGHVYQRDQFYGSFNDLLSGKCLLFLDEATWGGDKKDGAILKGLITSDDLTINRKYIPPMRENSMIHLIIASNEDWPVGVDRDDRRLLALRIENPFANKANYFKPLYQEIDGGGRSALLAALMDWPINDEILRDPPMTEAKEELKVESHPPAVDWWLERLHEGRLTQGDKGWVPEVVKRQLYAEYSAQMQIMGIGRRKSPQQLTQFLKRVCPSVEMARPRPGAPRIYRFPPLDIARSELEAYLKTQQDW